MSIIEAYNEKRRQNMPLSQRNKIDENDEANANAKILDLVVIKSFLSKVIEHHTTSEENCDENRKFVHVWEVNLRNILGYVDEPTWVFMIEAFIQWAIEEREKVQPNGKWEVFNYEIKQERRIRHQNRTVGKSTDGKAETIELKTPYDILVVGLQLVDIKNEYDMPYEFGRASTRKDSFDPRRMAEMMKNASGGSSPEALAQIEMQETKLAEQAKIIAELKSNQKKAAAEQQKTNDLMAALLSEIKEQKGGRSASTRGKK